MSLQLQTSCFPQSAPPVTQRRPQKVSGPSASWESSALSSSGIALYPEALLAGDGLDLHQERGLGLSSTVRPPTMQMVLIPRAALEGGTLTRMEWCTSLRTF